jgi:hypothetical protein
MYVDLRVVLVPGFLTGYRQTSLTTSNRVHIYAAFVGPEWTPAEPVRYFVHHDAIRSLPRFKTQSSKLGIVTT